MQMDYQLHLQEKIQHSCTGPPTLSKKFKILSAAFTSLAPRGIILEEGNIAFIIKVTTLEALRN